MKYTIIFFIFLFFSSCVAQDFPSISAEEAYEMKAGKDTVVFVDVRTVAEFEGPLGHIDGAILIPLHTLNTDLKKLDPYKEKKIIVYCRSGNRSQEGTRILRKNGFDAVNMLGGMRAWNKIPQED